MVENKTEDIIIKPVDIEIYSLRGKITAKDTLWFEALTSSGTYIRSLAHDMGQAVGTGAYLAELKREGVGEFHVKDAFTLEELARHVENSDITGVVTPIEVLLPEFPRIIVNHGGRIGVINGQPLPARDILKVFAEDNAVNENVRLFDDEGKLLAIARKDPKLMRFKPYIVFPT